TLEEMLAQEMGVAPAPSTTALITSLKTSALPTSPVARQSMREPRERAPSPAPSASNAASTSTFPGTNSSQAAVLPRLSWQSTLPRLPVALTRFIGRTKEIAHLVASLAPQQADVIEGED